MVFGSGPRSTVVLLFPTVSFYLHCCMYVSYLLVCSWPFILTLFSLEYPYYLFSYVCPFPQEGGKKGGPNTLEYSLHVILLTLGEQCHRVLMILLTLKGNFIVLVLLQRVHWSELCITEAGQPDYTYTSERMQWNISTNHCQIWWVM